ncbi:MAG: UDP-N-acetylmuramoyl-L-alanine--D-glutamate ligase [Oscillospiraceae bacterium]|nr:UDP-N-acetylmuramoyl-L-alanine--D-glutamate ligase [Oscillospiraceae bacterium]
MTLKNYLTSLRGKSVAVVGAGLSNRPLIPLLTQAGADVTIYDQSSKSALGDFYRKCTEDGVKFHLGEDYLDGLAGDIIFRTPGVLPTEPALVRAAANGAVLTSEMELFLSLCPCRVLAVTGSAGKTTTSSILATLMKNAGYKVWLGGNIGHPLLAETDEIAPDDVAVLELSSFQLHSMTCAPDVAVITNLSPNHLDKHGTMEDYISAKKQIFLHQTPKERLVLNRDDALTAACAQEARCPVRWFSRRETPEDGVFLREDGMICLYKDGEAVPVVSASVLKIPGLHNVDNMMAAFAAAWDMVPVDVMEQTARTFSGVPHRLEVVGVRHGATFINDSIATSPDRTIAGLACFREKVILIAGGKDKGLPFDDLGEAICTHVKSLYLTGWTAEKIKTAVENAPSYVPGCPEIHVIGDFAQTVQAAAEEADCGDTVLLSPACTSFDCFKNFEERGDAFRRIISEME